MLCISYDSEMLDRYTKPTSKNYCSSDEGRLLRRLASPLSWLESCKHTAKITADGQSARTFCVCVRGNNSPPQQVAVVCIRHSKRETGRPMTADISRCYDTYIKQSGVYRPFSHHSHSTLSFIPDVHVVKISVY